MYETAQHRSMYPAEPGYLRNLRHLLDDRTERRNQRALRQAGTSGGLVFLFSLITCGIYSLFWMYQMGNAVETLHDQHGEPRGSAPVVYLLLSLFGLGIVLTPCFRMS